MLSAGDTNGPHFSVEKWLDFLVWGGALTLNRSSDFLFLPLRNDKMLLHCSDIYSLPNSSTFEKQPAHHLRRKQALYKCSMAVNRIRDDP